MLDPSNGTPGAPPGETATNRSDRIRITMPRESRHTEYRPNRAGAGQDPANRADRLRETDVHGLTLKHYIERKTDRF